jgi:hypothetical protein
MLDSYYQNRDASMTREAYFEMCEMLGSEPVESEIPVEFEDFPETVQQCFAIYSLLTDVWDTMGGNYLGKDYNIVFDLFRVYEVDAEQHLFCLNILQQMDASRSKLISDKIKAKNPATK